MRRLAVVVLASFCSAFAMGQSKIDLDRETLGQTGKIPVLVISGNDTFHRWKETTPALRSTLEKGGRLETRLVEDVFILESAAALRRYKAIVFNQQVAGSTKEMRRNLEEYVKAGGGLVAIHWAIDNFHDWPEFEDLLGRRWKEGTSGEEHGSFEVKVVDTAHPIGRRLTAFKTPDQEAIHFDLAGSAKVHVIATALLPKARQEVAVGFAHEFGMGRVFFTPLGHSKTSRDSDGFRQLLTRAVEWAATGDVDDK
jgi:type 1 glutamine amidotransferase